MQIDLKCAIELIMCLDNLGFVIVYLFTCLFVFVCGLLLLWIVLMQRFAFLVLRNMQKLQIV